VAHQRQQAVGDEIAGRLIAADEQQPQGRVQLLVSEPLTLLLGRDERSGEVAAGLLALAFDQQREVVRELLLDAVGFYLATAGRSSSGTPSSSEMTAMGSGVARSPTTSSRPAAAAVSMISLTRRWMNDRSTS